LFDQARILENFLVLEGIDGAGTTSQLTLIDAELNRLGKAHFATCEPTKGEVGRFIRSVLSGKVRVQPGTLAFLFASDRYEHIHAPKIGIEARHSMDEIVISDRYLFSSLAYQSIETDPEFVSSINRMFPLPKHLVFLDIPIDVAMERLAIRGEREIFEKRSFQISVIDSYYKVLSLFEGTNMKIHKIDGRLSKERVFSRIWEIIETLPIFTT
jgi:dTMP kinase